MVRCSRAYQRRKVTSVRSEARRILGIVGLGQNPDARDVEIAVLRHQLAMVRRQVARPHYTPSDRMVRGASSA